MATSRKRLASILGLALGVSAAANGTVLFDNLDGIVMTDGVIDNGGSSFGNGQWAAEMFTTDNHSYQLDNVTLVTSASLFSRVAVGQVVLDTKLEIFSGANGPGSTLVGTLDNSAGFNPDLFEKDTFTPNGSIKLDPNTTYWVKLTGPTTDGDFINWAYGGANPNPWVTNQGRGSSAPFLMSVEGTLGAQEGPIAHAPIPSTVWLLGSSVLGLFVPRRGKRNQ